MRRLKRARAEAGRATRIVVAGCVAQAEGARDPAPRAGRRRRRRAAELPPSAGPARRRAEQAPGVVDTEFPVEDKFDHLPAPPRAHDPAPRRVRLPHRAGGLRQVLRLLRRALHARRGGLAARRRRSSREAERLADAGVREITLHRPERQRLSRRRAGRARRGLLARLAARLAAIPGIARLRYTTSHPRDMDDDLIAAHRDLPALMPYLHLPVQSGSDRILAAMNRKHARRRLPPPRRPNSRRAARHRALLRFHRRLPRRDRRRFRRNAAARRGCRLRQRLLVQVQPPPRHAGGRSGRPRCRKR